MLKLLQLRHHLRVYMTSSTPYLNTDEICTGPKSEIFTRSFEIQRIFVEWGIFSA